MNLNFRKKPVSEHVYAQTVVWECPQCHCWSREEFVNVDQPECPLCHSSMQPVSKNIRIE